MWVSRYSKFVAVQGEFSHLDEDFLCKSLGDRFLAGWPLLAVLAKVEAQFKELLAKLRDRKCNWLRRHKFNILENFHSKLP